jgi:murein tripeptide amidase MpaA
VTYLNVVEIESALQNLAVAYPDAAELIACPHPTHEGRGTHVLRVGTSGAADADGALLLGGVHSREWVPPDALVSLAADLLEAYRLGTGLGYGGQQFSAADVARIMADLNLFVFACVNPDGRYHSQTADAFWRKNRRPHPAGGGCIGVDLNRNFDFLWDHVARFASDSDVRTSADPCDRNVYRGPGPASEPEVRNVVWLLDSHPRICWLVDVHSAVPVILHNWGSDENQTTRPEQTFTATAFDAVRGRPGDTAYGEFIHPADLETITALSARMNDAVKAVRGDDYGVEQAYGLYPTSGASDDYAFSRSVVDPAKAKIYGFTIECGHTFQPDTTEAENVIREVSSGLVALAVAATESSPEQLPAPAQANEIALVHQTPGRASIPVAAANGDVA